MAMYGYHLSYAASCLPNILQSVNDLAISPIDPTILASVSIDHSLRIWSLHPDHEKQPLGAICYGQGHKDQVLTIVCDLQIYPINILILPGIPPERPVHPNSGYGYQDQFGRMHHPGLLLDNALISLVGSTRRPQGTRWHRQAGHSALSALFHYRDTH